MRLFLLAVSSLVVCISSTSLPSSSRPQDDCNNLWMLLTLVPLAFLRFCERSFLAVFFWLPGTLDNSPFSSRRLVQCPCLTLAWPIIFPVHWSSTTDRFSSCSEVLAACVRWNLHLLPLVLVHVSLPLGRRHAKCPCHECCRSSSSICISARHVLFCVALGKIVPSGGPGLAKSAAVVTALGAVVNAWEAGFGLGIERLRRCSLRCPIPFFPRLVSTISRENLQEGRIGVADLRFAHETCKFKLFAHFVPGAHEGTAGMGGLTFPSGFLPSPPLPLPSCPFFPAAAALLA